MFDPRWAAPAHSPSRCPAAAGRLRRRQSRNHELGKDAMPDLARSDEHNATVDTSGSAGLDQDELPVDLAAYFAPLLAAETRLAPDTAGVDSSQRDSMEAQAAFDAAVAAAAADDEDGAVQQYIRAAKTAETAREWHLAAVACQRVGDFLIGPGPPYDLERAFRMYRRAVAAYEQSGLFAEARRLAYRQLGV